MADNHDKSKQLIASYLGKRVTAKLDGKLFDHVPATFRFRFRDPEELCEELAGNYTDELGQLDCLDEDGEWINDNLIPVASVSSIEEDADPGEAEDDEPYEFAWIFLDWRAKQPAVAVMTSDDWGLKRTKPGLAALKLEIG